MKKRLDSFICTEDLIQSGKAFIEEFDPSTQSYLDRTGQWQQNPESIRDCISNEILFFLWKLKEENRNLFIQNVFSPFISNNFWMITKKIFHSLQRDYERRPSLPAEDELNGKHVFLIILEILGWIIACEACQLNSVFPVARWDTWAKEQQQEAKKRYRAMTGLIDNFCDKVEKTQYLSHTVNQVRKTSPEFIEVLSALIAEEQRITQKINFLLKKAENRERREEILPLVIEKILPPMGIVTNTSPALLRPCLRLLMDDKIEIESGIQYNASVILSILQDPRSIETLLKAIDHFPLNYSKLRENLIYTLGNLKVKKAVKSLIRVLESFDEEEFLKNQKAKGFFLLTEQKAEAIVALGKIGLKSLSALSSLIKYEEHPSPELQTHLAWTLGEIGKSQKVKFGGVSADIIISMLKLLQVKNKKVFEESVNALKKINMPEFIHSLYLYNVGAVNILGLKPAQKGLYELSETIHFLIRKNGRAIIAVNGDSGTGKTYFCQSLMNGFGDIHPNEILYLMRDRKKDQKIFNRILGIKWLKNHIDPVYYHDYPLAEEKDKPEEFFFAFLEENKDKKLIILDGCRDKYYFQRIIDLFYFRGKLDVEVNFRATISTRRFNLEEREIALESVKTHLSFLEEPALEDTYIYREGKAILFDLDNSINCRLIREEIQELFSQVRIESWGEFIRIGEFNREAHSLKVSTGKLSIRDDPFALKTYGMEQARHESLLHEERKFRMELNHDLAKNPHHIGTIDITDLKPTQIRFYAQNQIAGLGEEGAIFILSFLDNRIFSVVVEKCRGLSLLGRKIFSINQKGECVAVNFEKNEKIQLAKTDSPALVSAALSTDRVITGHLDGSIIIWDFSENAIHIMKGHDRPVLALAADYNGRIYSASSDPLLKRWDLEKGQVSLISGFSGIISQIRLYPQKKILAAAEDNGNREKEKIYRENLMLLDLEGHNFQVLPSTLKKKLTSVNVHFDGRIFTTYAPSGNEDGKNLVLLSPNSRKWEFKILDSHEKDTKDCFIMGPKLITCGTETQGNHTIRLWGSDVYARTELNKLIALSERT
jgi:hypothetical protein